jgi:hypothetical protein
MKTSILNTYYKKSADLSLRFKLSILVMDYNELDKGYVNNIIHFINIMKT